jgi:hypothetical protein
VHKPNPEELEPKDYEPDEEPKPAGGDQLASPKSPEKALGKLIASLVDFVGLDAGYPGVTKGMAKAVIFTLASGDVPQDHVLRQLIDLPIYDEEWESIKEYLGVIANNKNSALVKALRDFLALKPAKNPNEEAEKATTEVLMEIPPELFKQMPAHVVEKYAKVIQKALYQTKGGWGADLLDGAKEAGIMALGLGKINGIVHQLILQEAPRDATGSRRCADEGISVYRLEDSGVWCSSAEGRTESPNRRPAPTTRMIPRRVRAGQVLRISSTVRRASSASIQHIRSGMRSPTFYVTKCGRPRRARRSTTRVPS